MIALATEAAADQAARRNVEAALADGECQAATFFFEQLQPDDVDGEERADLARRVEACGADRPASDATATPRARVEASVRVEASPPVPRPDHGYRGTIAVASGVTVVGAGVAFWYSPSTHWLLAAGAGAAVIGMPPAIHVLHGRRAAARHSLLVRAGSALGLGALGATVASLGSTCGHPDAKVNEDCLGVRLALAELGALIAATGAIVIDVRLARPMVVPTSGGAMIGIAGTFE